MKWPWIRRSTIDSMEASIKSLEMSRESLERSLMRARVLKFARVVEYKKDMNLNYDSPKSISLEDLLKRIEVLESKK